LFWLSRKIDYPLVPADALQINFSFDCNLRCKMCSMHERMESNKALGRPVALDALTIKKLIKEGADMKVRSLILIGGEPFLEPQLFDIVSFGVSCGIPSITVVTNGTIMSEQIAEKMFESGLTSLSVSIDAASEDTFARIRGQRYLEKIIANINLINEMKEKRKEIIPGICCVCTIMDQNLEELTGVIELCRKLKIGKIIFQPVVGDNTDQAKLDADSDVFVKPERFKALDGAIDSIIEYKTSSEENFDFIANSLQHLEAIKKYLKGRSKASKMNCYAGYNRIQVVQEGKLYFCVSQNHHEATLGDVKKESLKDLWCSSKAREFRKSIRKCRKPCLQWCSYRDDFDVIVGDWQKRKLFKKACC